MDMFTLWALFVVLPEIKSLAVVLFVGGGILTVFVGALVFMEGDISPTFWRRAGRRIGIPLIVCGVIASVTPSTKQMMLLVGGYAATNIEGIEKLPPNLVNAANAYLESVAKSAEADK